MATVLLYADEPVLAEELSRILKNISGLDLIDCCHGLESLRGRLELHQPDILLVGLTEDVTYAVLSSLREAVCFSRIVLWAHAISAELASQSLSLGIRGILRRNRPPDTVIRCLMRVNEGELWLDKALTESMMTAQGHSPTRRLVAQLSQGLKSKVLRPS
jgi:DNA-binding NarL/FixJ family response regulator